MAQIRGHVGVGHSSAPFPLSSEQSWPGLPVSPRVHGACPALPFSFLALQTSSVSPHQSTGAGCILWSRHSLVVRNGSRLGAEDEVRGATVLCCWLLPARPLTLLLSRRRRPPRHSQAPGDPQNLDRSQPMFAWSSHLLLWELLTLLLSTVPWVSSKGGV